MTIIETVFAIVVYGYMGIWTFSGACHAYAAYEEARYQREVTKLNQAAAAYLKKHGELPEAADFSDTLTLK